MGTPEFAVPSLEALCDHPDRYGGEVVAVVTQPDRPAGRKRRPQPSPVKVAAQARGLPVLQPESLRKDAAAVQALREFEPSAVVVAAYGLILPKTVLDIPPFGCINVHASLLPAFRGASPINAALLEGCTETGISIMLMDEGLDTGPVLSQATIPIAPQATATSLTTQLAQLGADLLTSTLAQYFAGTIAPTPQSELPGTPSLCGRINKQDGQIDWTQPAAVIERMTRAYTPWPTAYTTWQGEPFKILRAHVQATPPAHAQTPPGTVVQLAQDSHAIGVVTGEGLLVLEEVQPAGKRAMDIASFRNGAPHFIGAQLGLNESPGGNAS